MLTTASSTYSYLFAHHRSVALSDQTRVDWRLTGNSTKTKASHGRVEVKINGTWGSFCNLDFSRADANVVCRHLGYASGDVIDDRYVRRVSVRVRAEELCESRGGRVLGFPSLRIRTVSVDVG